MRKLPGRRAFCINCKQGKHSVNGNSRCKGQGCECKCSTHYLGRDGQLYPYGIPDDSIIREEVTKTPNPEFEGLLEEARKILKHQ